jgi:hypothetical protein
MKFSTPVAILALFATVASALPNPQKMQEARDLGEVQDLEIRKGGGGGAGEALQFGIELAVKGIQSLINGIKKDKEVIIPAFLFFRNKSHDEWQDRGKFTFALVSEMSKKNPKFNYVICHTKHETK